METLEKSPEAVKKEEKKAEKKPERKLKLPEDAAKYLNEYLIKENFPRFISYDLENQIKARTQRDARSAEYNRALKDILLRVLDTKGAEEEGLSFLAIMSTPDSLEKSKASEIFHKYFNDFFSPLVDKEKNEKKLKELNEEKHGLVGELEKINKYQLTSKSQKKEKVAPIETRLLELSRTRKQLEEKLRSPDVLLEFIPGYRKDLEEFKEGFSKTYVLPEQRKKDEKDFRENWVKENLIKKLEKLRKDLEGLL